MITTILRIALIIVLVGIGISLDNIHSALDRIATEINELRYK